jgi:hypothetical protein
MAKTEKQEAKVETQENLIQSEVIDAHVNVLVRVLYTCELGRANDVVSVCSASELDILQRAGYVDADPAAVAYAQSLQAPKQ